MIKILSVLIVGTLLLSALLTPPLYSALSLLVPAFPWPFSRVFDRVLMVIALLFLVYYRREIDLSAARDYLRSPKGSRKGIDFILGASVSLLCGAGVLFAIVKGEALLWGDRTVGAIFAKLPAVLVGAAVVSVLEEVVFRGILLHRLQRYLPAVAAAVLTSVMYAAVHFITPVKSFTYDHYSWSAGFVYLGVVVERIVSPGTFPAFIGLVLVGMVLAWVMIRSRSIYACIGLHTGWIVAVKMTGYTTVVRPGYVFSPGAGQRYYLVSEPIAWVSILAVGAIMVRVLAWISARGCGTLPSPGGCGMLRVNGAEVTNGMTSSR